MRTYLINEDSYNLWSAQVNKNFNPKSVFQVPFILPFNLPVRNGLELGTSSNPSDYFMIMHFRTIDHTRDYSQQLLLLDMLHDVNAKSFTYLEVAFIVPTDLTGSPSETYQGILNTCLVEINEFLVALSFYTKNTGIFKISKGMLNTVSIFRCFRIEDWGTGKVGMVSVNTSDETYFLSKELIKDEEVVNIRRYINDSSSPFRTSEIFAFDSLRHLRMGLHNESVISIQTSIESFLANLYILCLHAEGLDFNAAIMKANAMALKNLVKDKHLEKRIGGTWIILDNTTEAGRWWNTTYKLRNDIVHTGYHTTLEEASNGIRCALHFREYLFSLLQKLEGTYTEVKELLNRFYQNSSSTFAFDVLQTNYTFNSDAAIMAFQHAYDRIMNKGGQNE